MVADAARPGRGFYCPKCRRSFLFKGKPVTVEDPAATDTQDRLATQELPAPHSPAAQGDDQDAIGTQALGESTADATPTMDFPRQPGALKSPLSPAEWPKVKEGEEVYGVAADPQDKPLLGKLGRFELRSIIGQGRFGTVYQGYDPVLERLVAIKVPKLATQSPEEVQRFLAEAKAAARLRHPNIVAVFDTGVAGNAAFIAAEFIEGVPLSVRIARDRPDRQLSARWVRDLALALAYAHEEGIVHRDVKPANILIDHKVRPLLTDFGLAMRVGGSAAAKEGAIVGTPAYMAPEQARGDAASIGPASDQYALGVILYELLTGKRPFDGATPVVLHKVLHTKPTPPRQRDRSIPRDLEAVCLRAMAKKPARRYPNTAEFAHDLQRWLSHEPVRARDSTRLERAKLWVRKYRNWLFAASIAAAGILLAAVAWSWVGAIQLKKELAIARAEAQIKAEEQKRIELVAEAERKRKEEREIVDKELREKRRLESADLRRRGIGLCQEQSIDEGLILLAEAFDVAAKSDDAAAEEVRIEIANWERQLFRIRLLVPDGRQVVGFSADSRVAVTLQEKEGGKSPRIGLVRCYDLAAERWLGKPIPHHQGTTSFLQFTGAISPDGQSLVTTATEKGTALQLWNVATGETIGEPIEHSADLRAFSPDGKFLITGNRQGRPPLLRFWETSTGQPSGKSIALDMPLSDVISLAGGWFTPGNRTLKVESQLASAAFSPDGKAVLTQCMLTAGPSGVEVLRLFDAANHDAIGPTVSFLRPIGGAPLFAFSADSQIVAVRTASTVIQLYDTRGFRPIGPPLEHDRPVQAMVFVPSAGVLITQSGDNATTKPKDRAPAVPVITVWDVRLNHPPTADAVPQRLALEPVRRGYHPLLRLMSADGRRLLTAEGSRSLQLCDAVTGKQVGADIPSENVVMDTVRFSPDGRWLLLPQRAASADWAKLHDTRTGAVTGQTLRYAGHATPRFSPDGRHLAIAGDSSFAPIWQLTRRQPLVLRTDTPMGLINFRALDGLAVSPDGATVEVRHADTLFRWNALTGESILDPAAAITKHDSARGDALAISPDGTRLLVRDYNAKTVQLRARDTKEGIGPTIPYKDLGQCAAFSTDSRKALFCHDEEVTVIDATSDTVSVRSLAHSRAVAMAIFSPDGRMVATAGGQRDGTARLFDASTGNLLHGELFHYHLGWPDGIGYVSFSPTGRFLVSGGNHRYLVWDTASSKMFGPTVEGKVRSKDVQPDIRCVHFSRDDSVVLTGTKAPEKKPGETPPPAKAFQLWDGATGRPIGGMIGPELSASSIDKMGELVVAFTPDGSALLIGYHKLAHVWDARMTRRFGLPLAFEGELQAAAFSADGRHVLVRTHPSSAPGPQLSLWPSPPACPGDSAGVRTYLQTATGRDVSADGKRFIFFGPAEWEERRRRLAAGPNAESK
jgi:WD40 repeat protein